ncbi:2-octaprenyl-6-methoxyphenyl hydroxylase [Alteromonas sp. a30]|uniref:2-octaprenyl-6-methoxyphenyl hydroxylase n=1 Tax=Alteromonas sp. a30 TaxID=2730917 RepID=UPI00227FA430|nr:2-octaprenyl-6-methoxyphenyl hydroxylase [Alteromonas sp. a30]MCY7295454.1 2-octaprenyl-6-methoxyphenyl hydroxylase [Alteromonas sp. a30]
MTPQPSMETQPFDFVIAGGGTVGCSLALALAQLSHQTKRAQRQPLRIAIIEAQDYRSDSTHPGFDGRAIALARHSLDYLASLGLQNDINAVTQPIQHIQVTDKGYLGQCDLYAPDYAVESLGRVIELHDFGRVLQSALQKPDIASQITWFCPDKITSLVFETDHVNVVLDSQQRIQAKLLLATDGGESGTRKLLNVVPEVQDYQQVALIANVRTQKPHNNCAFERFTQNGPIAFLPMTDERCSVVWTLNYGDESALLNASEAEFISALQAAFGYRLGKITQVGLRAAYPLRLLHASGGHLHRAALLGNAAQTLHPIAGQGFNLGIRDVEDLVACVKHAVESGDDVGTYTILSAYRALRKQDAKTTISATHALVHLFSDDAMLKVVARNLGLAGLQFLPSLKHLFAQRAMGRRRHAVLDELGTKG